MLLTILYVGRDAEITTVMERLLNARPEWTGIAVCSDEEAISVCEKLHLDLVLLGNGIDEECEQVLKKNLTSIRPDLKIIQHYGGGSGLLYGEILQAILS
ncbi:hypothetical protein [Pedobacter nototheniae]|uniref:hypothetical protein n=1 Tax=Pedobacter nototheniae TaxID=2488994 RepID=UPI0029300173|nr:hypothetical protein [Pedobacter nototheniae]